MMTIKSAALALFAALSCAVTAAPASAQATRTWVSGVGDDANPCSRTAPCKTFPGAISKTATGGEINCLDPGGFGAVTITKSISIVCDFTEGGVLTAGAGVNGMVINVPSGSSVFLSGLDFNGSGSAQNGLRIVNAGTVHLQNSIIRNFRAANGLGMSVQPSGFLNLTVVNTTIADNGVIGSPGSGGGILIQPTGATGTVRALLSDIRVQDNGNNALSILTTGNTAASGIFVAIEDSEFRGSFAGINVNSQPGTNRALVVVNGSVVSNNGTGITLSGSVASLAVGDTTIFGNDTGLAAAGGANLTTFQDNRVVDNGSSGAFTGTVSKL